MKKNITIFNGSYSGDLNHYKVEPLTKACEENCDLFTHGFGGYAPLCLGSSEEEVYDKLEEIRGKRKSLFKEFEEAITEYVTALVDESYDVHIITKEEDSERDSYLKDGITIIPEDMKERPCPVVSLDHCYRLFFGNTMKAETSDAAIEYVAHDIVDTLMEMWEDPQDCPSCD